MTINRHLHSPFWTNENDALLRKLEAAGFSATKIAAKLGVTPRSVKRRSRYLQGKPNPSDWPREALREKTAMLREEKERQTQQVLSAMQTGISRGTPTDAAIISALMRGAGPQAIAKELGVSRQFIYRRIWKAAAGRELRARAQQRKERQRAAITALRAAIDRGMAREAAIIQARKAGATYAAIGKELGLTRQRVHQLILLQD